MDFQQLYGLCEQLQMELTEKFQDACKEDIESDTFEAMLGITSNNIAQCFSEETIKLANVLDKVTCAMGILDDVAFTERERNKDIK